MRPVAIPLLPGPSDALFAEPRSTDGGASLHCDVLTSASVGAHALLHLSPKLLPPDSDEFYPPKLITTKFPKTLPATTPRRLPFPPCRFSTQRRGTRRLKYSDAMSRKSTASTNLPSWTVLHDPDARLFVNPQTSTIHRHTSRPSSCDTEEQPDDDRIYNGTWPEMIMYV